MTDQNNEGWPAVLRLNDHYMEEIVGWMQADDKVSDGMTYIRADHAAPEGQVRAQIANLSVWAGKAHPDQQLVDLSHVLAILDSTLSPPPAPPAAPTDNTALVERHANKQRNVIINRCSTDLETIINGHDPEIGNLNNDVWDRLDKMAVEIEAALASREAPPAAQEPEPDGCLHGYCDAENCPACSQEEQEAPPASDSGEKPLCPVCYNRTDAELRTIGGFYSMESNCPECSPRAKERAKQDADREALVRLLQIITRNGSLDDGRTLHEVIADALLARGLRLPAPETMAWAVVGGDGQIKHVTGNGRNLAKQWAGPGDSIKRVAIRVVEGGDDAA